MNVSVNPLELILKAGRPADIPYRADVDGLRAIAVISVIGFHAGLRVFPGGFVGVDIFFTISGFLISSLIVSRLNNNSFSYVEFYGRRIRRLFPALIVVLLATAALGWFVLFPGEYAALGRSIAAGAAFAANIEFYLESGYFDALWTTKPLLHLWSLGVEEQFYIIFPALLALVWQRRTMKVILVLTAITSFVLNLALVRKYPFFTFYIPLTRFWEFLAGTMLAIRQTHSTKSLSTSFFSTARQWQNYSSLTGVMLIIVAIAFSDKESFPGWWATLPVLGTVCIIVSGQDAWVNRTVLSNRTLVYIGLISYPLYLWHWPLLVLGHTMMRLKDNRYENATAIIAIGLAFILSALTYQFIERPIRARQPILPRAQINAALCMGMALIAVLGLGIVKGDGIPSRYPKEAQALVAPLVFGSGFPDFSQSMNSPGPLLVTLGDSLAYHLMPGLHELQKERAFRYQMIRWGDCTPVGYKKPVDPEDCLKSIEDIKTKFSLLKPDILVITRAWHRYQHVENINEIIRFFQSIGVQKIILIGMVPFWSQPPQILLYKSYLADPMHPIPDRLFGPKTLEVDARLKGIAADLGVEYVSTYNVFCNENGCLVRLGSDAKDILQIDRGHFSAAGSWYLISHIADEIFNGISSEAK